MKLRYTHSRLIFSERTAGGHSLRRRKGDDGGLLGDRVRGFLRGTRE